MSEKKEKHNYFKIVKMAIGILYKTSKGYFVTVFILGFTSSLPDIINLFVWKNIIDEIAILIAQLFNLTHICLNIHNLVSADIL